MDFETTYIIIWRSGKVTHTGDTERLPEMFFGNDCTHIIRVNEDATVDEWNGLDFEPSEAQK